MENLMNESWGRLEYDEKKNHLNMVLEDSKDEQAELLYKELVRAVKEHQPDTIMCDLSQHHTSTDTSVGHSLVAFKEALYHGVKRIATLMPTSDHHEQQIIHEFIADIGVKQVRYFDNKEEAISWLEGGGEARKAA